MKPDSNFFTTTAAGFKAIVTIAEIKPIFDSSVW